MGLGLGGVRLISELWRQGLFKNVQSVLELGSQELHLIKEDFEDIIQTYQVPNYCRKDFTPWKWPHQPRCSAEKFYKLLGIREYTCIYLNKNFGSIPHDLNEPFLDESLYGKFDMATDFGCAEHIFNMPEAYKTIHKLLKPGGIAIVNQGVIRGNGYYLYDLPFFEGIAAANNYRIFSSSYEVNLKKTTERGSLIQHSLPASVDIANIIDYAKIDYIGITYVFQKQENDDFKYPYQGLFLS